MASGALALAIPAAAGAQGLPGPVTGLLAIGTFPPGTNMSTVHALLPEEVRDTVGLYLRGKIGQWFSLADRAGVVFILNGTDPVAARSMLEALPLGRAHLMRFDLLPLAPLAPLGALPGLSQAPRL